MPEPGLCGSCVECRVVQTGRSTFFLCERSRTDSRYRRYPVIPVTTCAGYVQAAGVAATATPTRADDGAAR
jgi:hypothetical protein